MKKNYRAINLEKVIDVEKRTVEVCFATETPYERDGLIEIIKVTSESLDLKRLNDGHPILFNHDPDKHLGIILKAWIDNDRVARALVRFAKNPLAEEKFQDVINGDLNKISYGYRKKKINFINSNTYISEETEAFEISFVTIPADSNCGVGRSLDILDDEEQKMIEEAKKEMEQSLLEPEKKESEEVLNEKDKNKIEITVESNEKIEDLKIEVEIKNEEKQLEESLNEKNKEEENLNNLVENFDNKIVYKYNNNINIEKGNKMDKLEHIKSVITAFPEYRDLGTQFLYDNSKTGVDFENLVKEQEAKKSERQNANIGGLQSKREYNLNNAIRGLMTNTRGLETEISDELKKIYKPRGEKSILIPISMVSNRAYSGQTAGNGGNLVETQLIDFIDPLRAKLVLAKAGINYLTDLQGQFKMPKMATGAEPSYINNETTDASSTNANFSLVDLVKNTLADNFVVPRDAVLLPSYDVKALGLNDALARIARKIDKDCLQGTTPVAGLLNIAGIEDVDFTGAATYAKMVGLKGTVDGKNALLNGFSYITTTQAYYNMMTISKSGTNNGFILENGMIDNSQVLNTTAMPIATGKHSIIAGDFSQAVLGTWGVLEIIEDPYSLSKRGAVQYTVLTDFGFNVRNTESFVKVNDLDLA